MQSGIAAWEEPRHIADWRWKTVSVFAPKLALVMPWLLAVASRHPIPKSFFLFYVTTFPVGAGAVVKRRMLQRLSANPPGFRGGKAIFFGERACSVSELDEPSLINLDFLTAYRHTALIEADSHEHYISDLPEYLCKSIAKLDGAGIMQILDTFSNICVIRFLEFETHSVMQFMTSPNTSTAIVALLEDRYARRIHDVRTIPDVIAGFVN